MAARAVGLAVAALSLIAVAAACDSSGSAATRAPAETRQPSRSQCRYLSKNEAGRILGVAIRPSPQSKTICERGGPPIVGEVSPEISFLVNRYSESRLAPTRVPSDLAATASSSQVALRVPGHPVRAWLLAEERNLPHDSEAVTNIAFWTPGHVGIVGAVGTADDRRTALRAARTIVTNLPSTSG
jgi:hypothetical protein